VYKTRIRIILHQMQYLSQKESRIRGSRERGLLIHMHPSVLLDSIVAALEAEVVSLRAQVNQLLAEFAFFRKQFK